MKGASGGRSGLWLVAAAVLAIGAWAFWSTTRSDGTGGGVAGSSSSSGAAAGAAPSSASSSAAPKATNAAAPGSPEFIRKVLDDYRAAAAYPPWSRIHDDGTRYKIEWNKPVVSELPFSDKVGAETTYHFAADRAHVMFGETLTSWIEVWEKGDPNKRLPVNIVTVWVMLTGGAKPGRSVQLEYKDVAGDRRYVNKFVPSAFAELKEPTQVRIEAEVEVDGVKKLLVRDFTYAPRQVLTIVGITDAIADGSVVVNLEVDVRDAGLYTFEANVFDATGATAIAYADVNQSLAVGKVVVPLKFFGKAFHDVGADGPYLVKDFRGFLRPSPSANAANIWWSDPRSHTTKPYKRSELSAAEWDSEEKRTKIKALEALASASPSAGPAPSASQPKEIHIDENGVAHEVP